MTVGVETLALRKLVETNVEVVEAGLRVVDTRFLIGQSSVDIVARDKTGALTLIAAGVAGDDEMFFEVVGAYRWCRRNPDAVRHLFRGTRLSTHRAPRMLFVVQRFARSFVRSMDDLGFEPVHGLDLLDLGVNGSATMALEVRERPWGRAALEPVRDAKREMVAGFTLRALEVSAS